MRPNLQRSAIAALALGSALVVGGCEKPNPGATVWSGTNSLNRQALCWSHDPAGSIDARQCAGDAISKAAEGARVPQIQVTPGNTVGFSVDPVVTDHGWRVAVDGQPLSQQPLTSTYFRFTMPDLAAIPPEGLSVEITSLAEDGQNLRGVWVFALTPAT